MFTDNYIITQFIYINEGSEQDFLKFEETVLPLLPKYNGKLMYRIRPQKESFIYPTGDEQPYEVHVVSFEAKEDFLNYKNDPVRIEYLHLGTGSIKKVIMIESERNNKV